MKTLYRYIYLYLARVNNLLEIFTEETRRCFVTLEYCEHNLFHMCSVKEENNHIFKGARSYFSKFSFLLHLKNHHIKDININFWLNQSSHLDVTEQFCILQLPISYCVNLITVTIIRHIFLCILRMEHFSV